ncbi:MAG TPA: hypothetical protein VN192_02195 [Flavobacterium sp.]|nr:hypothetical protein [Flavobacterium sp.]
MTNKNQIVPFCSIQNNQIIVNGDLVFSTQDLSFVEFSKNVYQQFEISYPKFFKMDNLSKLAFIGSELLLKNEINPNQENKIALVLSNKSSSLDTDLKYQNSISDAANYYPSPAVFVYTLPNICLGEISIRHRLNSENSFFIFDEFNPEFLSQYSDVLIQSKKAEKVLCGWVEYFEEQYKSFLFLLDNKGDLAQKIQFIKTVYNQ